MDTVLRVLRHVDLFNGLSDAQLAGIAQHAERVVYQSGDVLIARDDACDAAILTVDGDAAVIRGTRNEPVEEPVLPGSILAEMAMMVDIEASATIIARSRVRALRIPQTGMLELLEADPGLAENLIEAITGRLRGVAENLKAIEQAWSAFTDDELSPSTARLDGVEDGDLVKSGLRTSGAETLSPAAASSLH
ncbi:MAG: cyclic nucleotide-binding domain-containing protein [Pseudomonadota bacterium]